MPTLTELLHLPLSSFANNVCAAQLAILTFKAALEIAIRWRPRWSKVWLQLSLASSVLFWGLYDDTHWSWRLNTLLPAAVATRLFYKVRDDCYDLSVAYRFIAGSPLISPSGVHSQRSRGPGSPGLFTVVLTLDASLWPDPTLLDPALSRNPIVSYRRSRLDHGFAVGRYVGSDRGAILRSTPLSHAPGGCQDDGRFPLCLSRDSSRFVCALVESGDSALATAGDLGVCGDCGRSGGDGAGGYGQCGHCGGAARESGASACVVACLREDMGCAVHDVWKHLLYRVLVGALVVTTLPTRRGRAAVNF